MLGRKSKKQKASTNVVEQKPYLAIDIGTEFVKVALARVNKQRQVEVIGYDRTPQKQNSMRGAMITNIEEVVNSVDLSIGNAMNTAEKVIGQDKLDLPRGAIVGIGGELVKGITIIVNYEREDADAKIDKQEIAGVLDEIRSQAYSTAKEEISAEIGLPASQIVEINTNVNSTLIDGVKVDNPVGFTGKQITYRIFGTFAPKIHVDALQRVAQELELPVVSLVVVPYSIAIGAKNARSDKFSGIFIDIGGGTTDVAVVENGSIVGTNMFAFGGRVFTKRLELSQGLDYLAAEKLKMDYSAGKLGQKQAGLVASSFQADMPIWLDGVQIALAEFEDVETYPARMYLCGGGAMLPEIKEGLLEYPWLKSLPFNQFPKVSFLLPNQINDVVDLTRIATDPRDAAPMALARMLLEHM